jgi:hypothetical protein
MAAGGQDTDVKYNHSRLEKSRERVDLNSMYFLGGAIETKRNSNPSTL